MADKLELGQVLGTRLEKVYLPTSNIRSRAIFA